MDAKSPSENPTPPTSSVPPPTPSVPPDDTGEPPDAPGAEGSGNDRKSEKCRKTEVVRVYDGTGKYWVDVEVLRNASFDGRQWQGPDLGNQSQETILQLVRKLTQDGSCGDVMSVGINPDKPITGKGGSTTGPAVKVPARAAAVLQSRNNVNRKFDNTSRARNNKLDCCKDMKRRVAFNDIRDELMEPLDTSGSGNGGGTGGGNGGGNGAPKQPPKRGSAYKNAVTASDDGSDLYLDICIPKDFKTTRAKDNKRQEIRTTDIWQNGNVDLPNAENLSAMSSGSDSAGSGTKGPFFKLDPYQVPINFGPDGLAVEFYDRDGPPKKGGGR